MAPEINFKQEVNVSENGKVGSISQTQISVDQIKESKHNLLFLIINRILLIVGILILAYWCYVRFSYKFFSIIFAIFGPIVSILFPESIFRHKITSILLISLLIAELLIVF